MNASLYLLDSLAKYTPPADGQKTEGIAARKLGCFELHQTQELEFTHHSDLC